MTFLFLGPSDLLKARLIAYHDFSLHIYWRITHQIPSLKTVHRTVFLTLAFDSIHRLLDIKKKKCLMTFLFLGPSDWSRTSGLLNPIQARYQTAPHPDKKSRRKFSCYGSPNWARTSDIMINSHALYRLSYGGIYKCWHLPIFTGRHQPTIFGTTELNFCVRDGNRWTLSVIDTNLFISSLLTFWVFGDPYGTRTHVAAVRGRSLNRLTNGPILFSTVELIPQLHRLVRHQGFEPGTP